VTKYETVKEEIVVDEKSTVTREVVEYVPVTRYVTEVVTKPVVKQVDVQKRVTVMKDVDVQKAVTVMKDVDVQRAVTSYKEVDREVAVTVNKPVTRTYASYKPAAVPSGVGCCPPGYSCQPNCNLACCSPSGGYTSSFARSTYGGAGCGGGCC
jgi:hypothetical protein